MEQSLATRYPQPYARALASVWGELEPALRHLEGLAATPVLLTGEDDVVALRALQYRLHATGEAVLALAPPAGTETEHAHLGAALMVARDATALVAAAAPTGPVEPLAYEWRAALFGVRL